MELKSRRSSTRECGTYDPKSAFFSFRSNDVNCLLGYDVQGCKQLYKSHVNQPVERSHFVRKTHCVACQCRCINDELCLNCAQRGHRTRSVNECRESQASYSENGSDVYQIRSATPTSCHSYCESWGSNRSRHRCESRTGQFINFIFKDKQTLDNCKKEYSEDKWNFQEKENPIDFLGGDEQKCTPFAKANYKLPHDKYGPYCCIRSQSKLDKRNSITSHPSVPTERRQKTRIPSVPITSYLISPHQERSDGIYAVTYIYQPGAAHLTGQFGERIDPYRSGHPAGSELSGPYEVFYPYSVSPTCKQSQGECVSSETSRSCLISADCSAMGLRKLSCCSKPNRRGSLRSKYRDIRLKMSSSAEVDNRRSLSRKNWSKKPTLLPRSESVEKSSEIKSKPGLQKGTPIAKPMVRRGSAKRAYTGAAKGQGIRYGKLQAKRIRESPLYSDSSADVRPQVTGVTGGDHRTQLPQTNIHPVSQGLGRVEMEVSAKPEMRKGIRSQKQSSLKAAVIPTNNQFHPKNISASFVKEMQELGMSPSLNKLDTVPAYDNLEAKDIGNKNAQISTEELEGSLKASEPFIDSPSPNNRNITPGYDNIEVKDTNKIAQLFSEDLKESPKPSELLIDSPSEKYPGFPAVDNYRTIGGSDNQLLVPLKSGSASPNDECKTLSYSDTAPQNIPESAADDTVSTFKRHDETSLPRPVISDEKALCERYVSSEKAILLSGTENNVYADDSKSKPSGIAQEKMINIKTTEPLDESRPPQQTPNLKQSDIISELVVNSGIVPQAATTSSVPTDKHDVEMCSNQATNTIEFHVLSSLGTRSERDGKISSLHENKPVIQPKIMWELEPKSASPHDNTDEGVSYISSVSAPPPTMEDMSKESIPTPKLMNNLQPTVDNKSDDILSGTHDPLSSVPEEMFPDFEGGLIDEIQPFEGKVDSNLAPHVSPIDSALDEHPASHTKTLGGANKEDFTSPATFEFSKRDLSPISTEEEQEAPKKYVIQSATPLEAKSCLSSSVSISTKLVLAKELCEKMGPNGSRWVVLEHPAPGEAKTEVTEIDPAVELDKLYLSGISDGNTSIKYTDGVVSPGDGTTPSGGTQPAFKINVGKGWPQKVSAVPMEQTLYDSCCEQGGGQAPERSSSSDVCCINVDIHSYITTGKCGDPQDSTNKEVMMSSDPGHGGYGWSGQGCVVNVDTTVSLGGKGREPRAATTINIQRCNRQTGDLQDPLDPARTPSPGVVNYATSSHTAEDPRSPTGNSNSTLLRTSPFNWSQRKIDFGEYRAPAVNDQEVSVARVSTRDVTNTFRNSEKQFAMDHEHFPTQTIATPKTGDPVSEMNSDESMQVRYHTLDDNTNFGQNQNEYYPNPAGVLVELNNKSGHIAPLNYVRYSTEGRNGQVIDLFTQKSSIPEFPGMDYPQQSNSIVTNDVSRPSTAGVSSAVSSIPNEVLSVTSSTLSNSTVSTDQGTNYHFFTSDLASRGVKRRTFSGIKERLDKSLVPREPQVKNLACLPEKNQVCAELSRTIVCSLSDMTHSSLTHATILKNAALNDQSEWQMRLFRKRKTPDWEAQGLIVIDHKPGQYSQNSSEPKLQSGPRPQHTINSNLYFDKQAIYVRGETKDYPPSIIQQVYQNQENTEHSLRHSSTKAFPAEQHGKIVPRHEHYVPSLHGTVKNMVFNSNKITPEAQEILINIRDTIRMAMEDLVALESQVLNMNFRPCEAITEHLVSIPELLNALLEHLHYSPAEYDLVQLASGLNSLINQISCDPVTILFHLVELGYRLHELAMLFGSDLLPDDLPRIVHAIQSKLHRMKIGHVTRQYMHVPQTSDYIITPYTKSRQLLRLEEECKCQVNLIHPEDPRAIYCPHGYRTIEVVYDEERGRHEAFFRRLNHIINPRRDTVRMTATIVRQINGKEFTMTAEDANELLNCDVRPRYRDVRAIILSAGKTFFSSRP
ncbi:unnamed protein product [Calicophoron daubneyi]|uniref:Uncharacterized protein n=1 Tax=Calicophoron daubneyi TaxID=300641 RepID=A0AAV2T2N4_CALDB